MLSGSYSTTSRGRDVIIIVGGCSHEFVLFLLAALRPSLIIARAWILVKDLRLSPRTVFSIQETSLTKFQPHTFLRHSGTRYPYLRYLMSYKDGTQEAFSDEVEDDEIW